MLQWLINGPAWRKVGSDLKNVDQTHLALASGKLVLQKHLLSSYAFIQFNLDTDGLKPKSLEPTENRKKFDRTPGEN